MVGIPRPLCPSKGGEEQGEDMFSRMKRVHPNRVDLDKTNGEKDAHRACTAVRAAQTRLGFVHAYSSETAAFVLCQCGCLGHY